MQITDLTRFNDEFVFHFGGEFHRINAETFANSLLELSSALKEINRVVNPEFEIEVYIDALGEGSFRTKIKTITKNVAPLLDGVPKALTVSLLATFIYEKIFAEEVEINIIVNDTSYIVEAGNRRIVLPKTAEEQRKKIQKNAEIEKRVSKAFKVLKADKEINDFGITENIQDAEPLVQFPRSDFPRLSEVRETIVAEEERRRQREEQADLLIIRAIFERGMRKWQFVWRDGIKISAPILDEDFYDKLVSHEYVIGTGDSLKAILRIYQYKDEMSGAWVNEHYEVIKVLSHSPGPLQHNLTGRGEA
ncbi:hypothetical protein [Sneathiella chinensis]|uniref:Uncharacterized protein n=1 Tax=Sneathiella chinensis TaxID=349750 RepID=A0ABQ5U0Z6_9PROT|nr:hypothetical protein [Sneathiella chinensis]GLQ05867.1 hypothetical protein GCM10007924_10880 [Sneathiella chinensis]